MTIDEKLGQVFLEVFGIDGIGCESSPKVVEGWDSMGHLNLVSELESTFDVVFSTTDIVGMENVECIKEILIKHGVSD